MQSFAEFEQRLRANEDVNFDNLGDTYLGRKHASMQSFKQSNDLKKVVLEHFKNIRWRDITWHSTGGGGYNVPRYPVLPATVQSALSAYNAEMQRIRQTPAFGTWYGVDGATTGVYFNVEGTNAFQRSHFPNGGVSEALRGVGIGPKLYRSLLREMGYLSSTSNAADGAQRSWASMVGNKLEANGTPTAEHVLSVMAGDWILAIDPGYNPRQAVQVAKSFLRSNQVTPNGRNFDVDPVLKGLLDADSPSTLEPFSHDPEAIARRAEAARAAAAAERDAQHNQLQTRLAQYCLTDENNHSWEVGDYIVVRDYLMQVAYPNLPTRRVVKRTEENYYVAILPSDVPAFLRTGHLPTDTRQCNLHTKQIWVKAKTPPGAPAPGPLNVPAPAATAAGRPAPTPATGDARTQLVNGQAGVLPADIDMHAGAMHTMNSAINTQGAKLYVKRSSLTDYSKGNFVYASRPRTAGDQERVIFYNLRAYARLEMTVAEMDALIAEHDLVTISATRLTTKRDVRRHDFVFMAAHRTLFGLICPVVRTVRGGEGTARAGQETVYVTTKPGGRAIETRAEQVKKVSVVTNEGFEFEGPDTQDLLEGLATSYTDFLNERAH
jgi:ribosomal protein S18 acetylase RimI-like enzyme